MLYTVKRRRVLGNRFRVVELSPGDSSGRPIFMSHRMWAAFRAVQEECHFDITIVQGAFMKWAGGGASSSAGYHDKSGCIDTRTWDIDSDEEKRVIRQSRMIGWATWRRDQAHGGFDEHMHWNLLDEPHTAPDARTQWESYRTGGDGLVPEGRDYHWRPDRPLPVFDYKTWKRAHR